MLQIAIGILAVGVLVLMLKYKVNIGWIMLVNSLFLAIAMRMSVKEATTTLLSGLVSKNTLGTILVLFLVAMIENIMRKTGMLNQLAQSIRDLFRGKLASAIVMPIVLGMLPSAGGARFSCPMVGEVLKEDTEALDKSYINYWYRHVWLDGFVLYPGIILASRLTGFSGTSIFLHTLVFAFVYMLIGLTQAKNLISKKNAVISEKRRIDGRTLIKSAFPIVLVLALYAILAGVTGFALEIACSVTVLFLLLFKRYKAAQIQKTLKEAFHAKFVVIIAGVMVFSQFLNASGVMTIVIEAILRFNFPIMLIFIVLPLIGGYISGISLTYVALVFPILIPLGLSSSIWMVVLAYLSGFLGIMISPVHICGIMSAEYFKVKYKAVLYKVAKAALYLIVAWSAVFVLIKSVVRF